MDALELSSQSERAVKHTDGLQCDSEGVSKDTSYLFRIWEVKREGERQEDLRAVLTGLPGAPQSIGPTQVSCGWNLTLGPSGKLQGHGFCTKC